MSPFWATLASLAGGFLKYVIVAVAFLKDLGPRLGAGGSTLVILSMLIINLAIATEGCDVADRFLRSREGPLRVPQGQDTRGP
jgi:hypothetical protein